jgi:nicotinamidase-related amidase
MKVQPAERLEGGVMKGLCQRIGVWGGGLSFALTIVCLTGASVLGGTIIDEWGTVKVPKPPELKTVQVEQGTTALLLLDFNRQTCNPEQRPRCIASIPKVKGLLAKARGMGLTVVYSLSAGATREDIARDLAPGAGEPSVTSGPDKFLGTDLEKLLKERGIRTVIVTGTAAHGAVLNTASAAALKGFKVVVPVEGLSAEDPFAELYTVWHLSNAPRISTMTTITSIEMIR